MPSLRFLLSAIKTNFKLSLALRGAFLADMAITLLKQSFFLISWSFFFGKYKTLNSWNFDDMLLMYGSVAFAIGFVEIFFDGLQDIPRLVDTSGIDVFLTQPQNPILNIALSRGRLSGLGDIAAGLILIGFSGYFYRDFAKALLILPIGVIFLFALYLYLGILAFFIKNSTNFIRELYTNANIVLTQPNSAFRGAFKIFTFTLFPAAFISFLPVEFVRTGDIKYELFAILGTFIFLFIACRLFKLGLKRYESGNSFVLRD